MVYFSFIGNHDKITHGQPHGAVLNIYFRYKEKLRDVFLFITPSQKGGMVNYGEIARQTQAVMEREKPGIRVRLIDLTLSSPVDFDLVYPVMLDATQGILEDEKLKNTEKIINITSGTPTMTACWVLLHKSGLIPQSKIIQAFETRFARQRGASTQEVNLEIDDFPRIEAPSALKRQLTIIKRVNEKLAQKVRVQETDEQIPELIGTSAAMREIKEQILYDIDDTTHVLIIGERGTGKEVVARAIWRLYRKETEDRLAGFDCGSFSRELIVSELFGHKKGAFTGAATDHEGILRKHDGQMLFLDEIGNLPKEGQQTLLRYLQSGEIRQLGSSEVVTINTQIIAATNKDINNPDVFAQDLKDRFDDVISLPPLRARREDIPILIDFFIRHSTNSPVILKKDLMKKLIQYEWPGNVRELEKWIKKLIRRFPKGGAISIDDIPNRIITNIMNEEEDEFFLPDLPLSIPLDEYVERIREKARRQSGGNKAEVDRLLRQKPGTEKQRCYDRKKRDSKK